MHPIHPITVHFSVALLCASVAFDALALRWPTGGLREASFYNLLAGVMSAALAVVTGGMEQDMAEVVDAPKSVLGLHASLGTVALVVFVALLGVRLAIQRRWLREIRFLTLGLGAIGVIIVALAGYWGAELVYTYGSGVEAVMPRGTL